MKGYAKLGRLMGNYPEVAIMRRFSALSAQNLLYMQAELRELEIDLRTSADNDDNSPHEDRKNYSINWYLLKESGEEDAAEGNDASQWETILEIREKLEKYQKALLRHREIANMTGPMPRDLGFLKKWMERTDMGNVYLTGEDRSTWSDEEWRSDLLSMRTQAADDMFFHWAYDKLGLWYHQLIGRHVKSVGPEEHLAGVIVYGEEAILHSTRAATTVLACLLPIASIVLLYKIEDMSKRLGIIAAFTASFSFALVFTTNARMVDIFAATAAYAAVQVVFIGTSTPGPAASSR
ncbi:hypothetical protein B0J14DRAFT_556574 [Halenospora varia]|nr:hypothetical protein B0J14DRAFT_556574 [Halenospora varia]